MTVAVNFSFPKPTPFLFFNEKKKVTSKYEISMFQYSPEM